LHFSFWLRSTPGVAKKSRSVFMENIIVGVVSLLLFVYLLVAMIWPEKF
jgi:K+-transporting ATPase KdpF subunit